MKVLFIKLSGAYREVNNAVFAALGLKDTYSIFGYSLRLEENHYDCEDEYPYTLFIERDPLTEIDSSDQTEALIAQIVHDLLSKNLKVAVNIENAH